MAIGALTFVLGVTALRNPNSPLVERWAAFLPLKGSLGPIAGVAFILVGAWSAIHQLLCGSYAQFPQWANLGWSWWPGIWPSIAIAAGIGIWSARAAGPILGSLIVLLTVGLGIAGGQAAGFHTGVYAGRWGTIAVTCGVLAWIINTLARIVRHNQQG
jgi:hypothetical protein